MSWHRFLTKANALSSKNWHILCLLMLGVFVKSLSVVFFDVGAVSLLIRNNGLINVGFDFLWISVLMSICGYYAWTLDRQRGHNAVNIVAWAVLILTGLVYVCDIHNVQIIGDLLFIYKYAYFILLTAAFWSIALRFVPDNIGSLKFAAIFGAELLGFLMAGLFVSEAMTSLLWAMYTGLIFLVILKGMDVMLYVPGETFFKKTGGVQDRHERRLVWTILMLAFFYMNARAWMDFFLYDTLRAYSIKPVITLGYIWSLIGGCGLVMLIALYRTRYIYTMRLGGMILGACAVATGIGVFLHHPIVIYTGVVVFMLCAHFYLRTYLSILPRPLALGFGLRVKKIRLLIAEPIGFMLTAILILQIPDLSIRAICLVVAGIVFLLMIAVSSWVYGELLLRMVHSRLWRGGPLMLVYPKLIQTVLDGVHSANTNDAIYFLRLLKIANHAAYQHELIRALSHPQADVRLFALKRLDNQSPNVSIRKAVERTFSRDTNDAVRRRALALLIRLELEENPEKGNKKYMGYLDGGTLRPGAVLGFLKAGGIHAFMAMDGLQKLASSRRVSDQIEALELIEEVPNPGLARIVVPLIQSPHAEVANAALRVAGAMASPMLLPYVLAAIDDVAVQEEALSALKKYGHAALPPVEKIILSRLDSPVRIKRLILFLGTIEHGEGVEVLMRLLELPNQALRIEVMRTILDNQIVWVHRDRKKILRKSLQKDVLRWRWLSGLQAQTEHAPNHKLEEAFSLLDRALEHEKDETRLVILYQLQLLSHNHLLRKATRILMSDQENLYPAAISGLQDLLPRRLYAYLAPILMRSVVEEASALSNIQAMNFLGDMIQQRGFPIGAWTRSVAVYGLRQLGDVDAVPMLYDALESGADGVLHDVIMWALSGLEKDKKKLAKITEKYARKNGKGEGELCR